MNEREEQDLAKRLADNSEVLDFDQALRIVQVRPAEAERLVRRHAEIAKSQEERERAREQRRLALRELL